MGEIDSFIQMYSNLKQRVMTDTEVDRIVNEASAMAEKSKNDEMLQHAAERIQETARGVKSNYDWSAIEKVDNVQELDRATNIYNARANNSGFHYDYTEKVLAKKLADLSKSEKTNPEEVFNLANKLTNLQILDNGDDEDKNEFATNVTGAYVSACAKTKYTPVQANRMLGDLVFLSQHLDCPTDAYVLDNLPLNNITTAERFLKYTERALQQSSSVDNGYSLIKEYEEIVKHHPEMAKKCNELVKKTADLQNQDYNLSGTFDAAHNYFEKVVGMDEVSNYDKTMARGRATTYGEKARIAEEMEKKSKQKFFNHYQKDYEFEL